MNTNSSSNNNTANNSANSASGEAGAMGDDLVLVRMSSAVRWDAAVRQGGAAARKAAAREGNDVELVASRCQVGWGDLRASWDQVREAGRKRASDAAAAREAKASAAKLRRDWFTEMVRLRRRVTEARWEAKVAKEVRKAAVGRRIDIILEAGRLFGRGWQRRYRRANRALGVQAGRSLGPEEEAFWTQGRRMEALEFDMEMRVVEKVTEEGGALSLELAEARRGMELELEELKDHVAARFGWGLEMLRGIERRMKELRATRFAGWNLGDPWVGEEEHTQWWHCLDELLAARRGSEVLGGAVR